VGPGEEQATIKVAKTPFRRTFIVSSPLARNLSRDGPFLIPDRRIHVRLDLARRESAVVDANLVAEALEELVPSARHREGDRLNDGLVSAALDVGHRDANGVGADGNRRGVPEEARGAIVSAKQ